MGLVSSLFEEVPWLRTALAWSVAIGAIWLIASVPAYLVLPYISAIRTRLASWLQKRSDEWEAVRAKRGEERHRAIENLCEGRLLWVPSVAEELIAGRKSLNRLERRSERIHERLATLVVPKPSFPPLPSPEQAVEESGATRVAWLNVIIAIALLAVLMVVNTGMLSQILREIIPASIRVAQIPLFYVFALLLTVIEAGIGFLHGTLSQRPNRDGPTPLQPGALVTLLAAVAIAFVEGFFYAQIGDENKIFKLTDWFSVRHQQIFFLWGAVLVLCLFGVGHLFIRSAQAIRTGGSIDHFRRKVSRVARDVHRAQDLFREVEESLGGVMTQASKTLEAAGKAKSQNGECGPASGPVTVSDVEAIYVRTRMWLVMVVGGLAILALIAAVTAIPFWVSLGEGIACLAIGLLLRYEDAAVQNGTCVTSITRVDRTRRALAVVALLFVSVLHVYLLQQLRAPRDIVGWLLSAATCVMLVAGSRELAGAFSAVGVCAGSVLSRLGDLGGRLSDAIVRLTLLAIILTETALSLIAAPLSWLRHRRELAPQEVQRAVLGE